MDGELHLADDAGVQGVLLVQTELCGGVRPDRLLLEDRHLLEQLRLDKCVPRGLAAGGWFAGRVAMASRNQGGGVAQEAGSDDEGEAKRAKTAAVAVEAELERGGAG